MSDEEKKPALDARRVLLATMASNLMPSRIASSTCRAPGIGVEDHEWDFVRAHIRHSLLVAEMMLSEAEAK